MSEAATRPDARLAWLRALREPASTEFWTLADWDRVVRLARRTRLLARLAESVQGAELLRTVPAQPRQHLLAEQRLARWRTSNVLWAMERVAAALDGAPYPRVLLKGAAYIGQDLSIGAGRLPSDLDVLVPKAHLADAQERLTRAGWSAKQLDDHDQRYYYEWSHEIPPMKHPLLTLELDLHHNILPPVARTTLDADKLFAGVKPSKYPGWQVLDRADQLLHSAAHLFFDPEHRDRVRDLVDIDGLFRESMAVPGFIDQLTLRAEELGLQEPLALACHFCVRWFDTPVPATTLERIASMGLGRLRRAWLLPLFAAALRPAEPDDSWQSTQELAAAVLLVRHHVWRMPPKLLAAHLWHKFRRARGLSGANARES